MSKTSDEIRKIASELEGYEPQMETFKGITPKACINIAIRMAVELLRERADDIDQAELDENYYG